MTLDDISPIFQGVGGRDATMVEPTLTVAAPVVAFVVSYVLYGILGKRVLGADDDYWPWIRGKILPALDAWAHGLDLYAERAVRGDERAVTFDFDPRELDSDPVDVLEVVLEDMGYHRNPLASYKHWKGPNQVIRSSGSWAKRYGRVRWAGDLLRRAHADNGGMIPPTWLTSGIGRFLQSAGDVFALRQVHVTLIVRQQTEGNVKIATYAHDEYNSLNPLVAYKHYRGENQSVSKGVRTFQGDVAEWDIGEGGPDLSDALSIHFHTENK